MGRVRTIPSRRKAKAPCAGRRQDAAVADGVVADARNELARPGIPFSQEHIIDKDTGLPIRITRIGSGHPVVELDYPMGFAKGDHPALRRLIA